MKTPHGPLLLALTLATHAAFGQRNASAHPGVDDMGIAANAWLDSLDPEQRGLATHDLLDKRREQWHYIPKPFEGRGRRLGVSLAEMRPDQRALAYGVLSSGLSHRGLLTATQIMSLERVLWELEDGAPHRLADRYYLAVFGDPASPDWAWRFEGHHVSLSFTIAGGELVAATPRFFGANPAIVLDGPRTGLQPLAAEQDLGRELVQSLSDEQRSAAVFSNKPPRDILTKARPRVRPLGDRGIAFSNLTATQQTALLQLIEAYAHRLRGEFAERELAAIAAAGHDTLRFAWAGGLDPRQGHYYRVQGPTFLIEYANTQNNANHVHCVWRDFDGDFGRDVLAEHYQQHHAAGESVARE
ncbi:MAG: DUF3500 domain-containing protein [Planctomycetota bacterium]